MACDNSCSTCNNYGSNSCLSCKTLVGVTSLLVENLCLYCNSTAAITP